jgi:nickel transport protein
VAWLTVLAALAGTAHAHKLKIFAMGEGKAISGYVYFPGGGRAQGLTVKALGPDGATLGEATTNAKGEFTIPVKFRCDYELVTQTADGHRATFPVKAADLADDLPPLGSAAPTPTTRQEAAPKAPSTSVAPSDAKLTALVEKAVRDAVRPLREQIEQYEEKRRLHDILGGIGYILGLGGLAFYFLGVRRRRVGGAEGPAS